MSNFNKVESGPRFAFLRGMEQIKGKFFWTLQIGAAAGLVFSAEMVSHGMSLGRPLLNLTKEQKVQMKELVSVGLHKSALATSKSINTSALIQLIQKRLPQNYKSQATAIAGSIMKESRIRGLDPLFLVAVIQTESSFNPLALGRHGEIGLMQIRPKTAKWLAQKLKHSGRLDLRDPKLNIKLGAYYFSKLRKKFNGVGYRYVAAYNMGARNVYRLISRQKEPSIYPNRVVGNYRQAHQALKSLDSNRIVASN